MKPLIGITVDASPDPEDNRTRGKLSLNWNYAQVVADAGGVPLLIPPQADPAVVAEIIDGWLIPGGNDIDSALWGEPLHPKAKLIAAERFRIEQELFRRIDENLPVLGICYGCQFLNVAEGGTVIQHLPDVTGHELDQDGTIQTYNLVENTLTAQVIGSKVAEGESWHHQAIGRVASTLRVTGKNDDGTIEALESTNRPWVIGVQWHPERTLANSDSKSLFMNFVEAAARYRANRR